MKILYKNVIVLICIVFHIYLFGNEIKDEIYKSIGARAAGIGGAFSSISDDYSAFFWNPAGIVNMNKINASVFFDSVFTGKQNVYGLNYTQPVLSDMGISITYLKTIFNDSSFKNDFLYLSFATYLHEEKYTAFGINLKLLNFSMSNFELNGFTTAFDVGFLFFPDFFEKKFKFSLVASDLDAKIKWSNGNNEKIPVSYRAGMCYEINNSARAALDIVMTNLDNENKNLKFGFSLGGEKYFLNDYIGNFGLRTGLFYMENFNLSVGLSYARKEFVLNYVFIPGFSNLGQTHKLDFTYFIGEDIRKVIKQEIIPEIKETNLVLLKQTLKNMEFNLSHKYISPNNDGLYDTIEFNLNNNPLKISGGKWKIAIADKQNKIVKEINGIENIQPKIIWDGKDVNGRIVSDGDYSVTYSFYIGENILWEKTRIINVDTKPPVFKLSVLPKIFAPIENSKYKRMQINVDFKDKDINLWNMIVLNEKNNIIRKMSGEGVIDKFYWNGDDALGNKIVDGKYKIKLSVNDFAGNVFEQIESIIIDTNIANFNYVPDKRIFDLGKDKINFISNKKDINQIKKINIQILDNNNKLLKTIDNLTTLNDIVSWNGTNEKNEYVRKGNAYIFKILIEQINNIEIEKQYIIQTQPPTFEGIGIQLILAAIDFEKNSFDIPVSEYGYLNQAAEAVNKYAKNYFLILKGYAIDFENSEKNLQLSINRVKSVYDYLVNIKKLDPNNIYIIGYGDGNLIEGVNKDVVLKSGTRVEVELLTK